MTIQAVIRHPASWRDRVWRGSQVKMQQRYQRWKWNSSKNATALPAKMCCRIGTYLHADE